MFHLIPVRIVGYRPSSFFFRFYGPRGILVQENRKKERRQYPATVKFRK